MAEKEHLNLIFIGHVDHGKSTTVGRILYETGALTEQQLQRAHQRRLARACRSDDRDHARAAGNSLQVFRPWGVRHTGPP